MSSRRKDIGNLVVLLGLGLAGFVGYHTWLKSNEAPPPVTQDSESESVDLSVPTLTATSVTPAPTQDPSTPPEKLQARTIDPAQFTASTYADTLVSIRTLIENGSEAEAQAQLQTFPKEIPNFKSYLAILWNNLGVLQGNTHGPETSIPSYKEGLKLEPNNPALNLNLAHAYWEAHDPALTKEFLAKLAKLVPDDPFPHLALADLLYGKEDLAGATRHLEMATARTHANPGLENYLKMVTEKVKGAQQTEQNLVVRESSHFVVKFDGGEDYAIWNEVLGILEDAYRDIGQKLGYFPSKPIHVILLTKEQFRHAPGSPAWADALFDPVLGRIKIPTQGALTDKKWLARVLRHEFVHALLHERMGLKAGPMPTWLNEGLAMQLAGDSWPDIDQVSQSKDLKLIPLYLLEGGWGNLPADAAGVAYLEGNSATRYLIDRFGIGKVHDILDRLKAGDNIGGAIQDHLMMPYEEFQKRWTENLNQKMAATRKQTG